jgi:arginyl-tRNA synthetase
MPTITKILADAVAAAMRDVVGNDVAVDAQIRPADPRFGDYQANGVLPLAKSLGKNPRQLAADIVARLNVGEMCEPPEMAGAGFINFKLKADFVAKKLLETARDERLGVPKPRKICTFVMDFSAPNVAKPMHVGHIRSTIIGDSLARVLRFLGHTVVTDNHIGDWGTQFGMLLVGWKKYRDDGALKRDPIAELERLYKRVYAESEKNEKIRAEARAELAKLQAGDRENRAIWENIRDLSWQDFQKIYRRLGVTFDEVLGESYYHDMLKAVVDDLRCKNIATESDGAMCVFFDDHPELRGAAPLIVQKADGAFLYATTDLATIKYRVERWNPDEIIYITDARQKLHFQQVFETAKRWGFSTKLTHITFGTILGEDGKPLKTREGTPVKLADLLDEAERRAFEIVTKTNPELPENARRDIARVVGIGAVKYADLSQNRTTDYIFSWEKMLALTGNTAPYLQYAYVRIRSIFRKGGISETASGALVLQTKEELDLAKHLLRLGEILQNVADDYKPNWLTSYLYDLAYKFSTFYQNCPVLQSAEPTRSSRLLLCKLTADVMQRGLNLLGIETIEQM